MQRHILALCFIALINSPLSAAKYPEAVWKARFTYRPFPDYPEAYRVRGRHLTGSGRFRMYVNTQGRVTGISIVNSTGHKELDIVAMKALIQWRGKLVPKWELDMPVTFSMDMSYRPRNPDTVKSYPGRSR